MHLFATLLHTWPRLQPDDVVLFGTLLKMESKTLSLLPVVLWAVLLLTSNCTPDTQTHKNSRNQIIKAENRMMRAADARLQSILLCHKLIKIQRWKERQRSPLTFNLCCSVKTSFASFKIERYRPFQPQ